MRSRVPKVDAAAPSAGRVCAPLRQLDLKKSPAISETIDWARSLLLLHAGQLDEELVRSTLNVLLKFEDDIKAADADLRGLCETTSLHGPDAQRTAKGSAMQSNLVSFIQVLRTHDVRVSPAETLDAMAVAATLGYANRNLLRDGLAMTLAKTPDEEAVSTPALIAFYQRLSDFSREDSQASAEPEVTSSAGDSPSLPVRKPAAARNRRWRLRPPGTKPWRHCWIRR